MQKTGSDGNSSQLLLKNCTQCTAMYVDAASNALCSECLKLYENDTAHSFDPYEGEDHAGG